MATTPLTKEASLESKLKQLQKATTEHNADINELWGSQPQRIYVHHSSCIRGLGNIMEDCKSQNTRMSAVKWSVLEMAV